ncbi:hypothetical protein [Chitiniphilus shinanonensis]|nr:hypothetical protein [Chitiniphilus shinanonensis]
MERLRARHLSFVVAALAHSMAYGAPQAASAPADAANGSLPWAWLILLGGLTLGGLFYLRRSERPVVDPYPETRPMPGWNGDADTEKQRFYHVSKDIDTAIAKSGRLPDGTDTAAFLRHAKSTFLYLRAQNDPAKLEQLRKYMTPELFEDLTSADVARGERADFPELHIELVATRDEAAHLQAQVRFYGKVLATNNTAPFQETWRFIKEHGTNKRWLLWSMSERD